MEGIWCIYRMILFYLSRCLFWDEMNYTVEILITIKGISFI